MSGCSILQYEDGKIPETVGKDYICVCCPVSISEEDLALQNLDVA